MQVIIIICLNCTIDLLLDAQTFELLQQAQIMYDDSDSPQLEECKSSFICLLLVNPSESLIYYYLLDASDAQTFE